MKNDIVKYAAMNAFLTTIYIIVVVSFMSYAQNYVGNSTTILIPVVMLSLFVFSAALTGSLIFGRPILWYLDGKKKEAVSLLAYTLGFFLVTTITAFILLLTL